MDAIMERKRLVSSCYSAWVPEIMKVLNARYTRLVFFDLVPPILIGVLSVT